MSEHLGIVGGHIWYTVGPHIVLMLIHSTAVIKDDTSVGQFSLIGKVKMT